MEFKLKPSVISKLTTCLQFIAVLSVLSKDYTGYPTLYYLSVYYLTALFTISSGLHYMHYWFKMMGEGGDNQGNIS